MDPKTDSKTLSKEEATQLFLENIDFVRAIASRYAPARGLLEDIVHDSYIYFIEKLTRWEYEPTKVLPLLKTITRGIAGRHWRSYLHHMPNTLRRIAEQIERASEQEPEEGQDFRAQRILSLKLCIQKLDPKYRELVELYYFGEENYDALVEKTGKSPSAMYKAMSRIRAMLHDCVERQFSKEFSDD